jgi:hypothetical protein
MKNWIRKIRVNEVGRTIIILSIFQLIFSACNTPRRALKSYYNSILTHQPAKAEKYLGEACKNILQKDFQLTLSAAIDNGMPNNTKRISIGRSELVGDTVLVVLNLIKSDGSVQSFDKNQPIQFADGTVKVYDFRYRLYKEAGKWKINLPYCRTKMDNK